MIKGIVFLAASLSAAVGLGAEQGSTMFIFQSLQNPALKRLRI